MGEEEREIELLAEDILHCRKYACSKVTSNAAKLSIECDHMYYLLLSFRWQQYPLYTQFTIATSCHPI